MPRARTAEHKRLADSEARRADWKHWVLATGGVYLGGGIPPKIMPALEEERFMQAFRSKGRFADMLARVPVHVILSPKSALLGVACHGLEL